MFCHVSAQAFNLITLNMNQFSTFLTFAVITDRLTVLFLFTCIFKTSAAGSIHHIFGNHSFSDHFLQVAVYCCRSDCNFTVFEVFSDFLYSNMLSLHGLQKSMLLSHLFYLISGFCHFDLSFSIWKSFLNYLH